MPDVELSDVLQNWTSTQTISMTSAPTGGVVLTAGNPTSGDGGSVTLSAGWAGTSGAGGGIGINAGRGIGAGTDSGNVEIQAGNHQSAITKGAYALFSGALLSTNQGGDAQIRAGDNEAASGQGGSVQITAGDGDSGAGVGGSITLTIGTGDTNGNLILVNIPAGDPGIAGALWNDAGALKISAGV
jgi:hypothetical protein